MSTVRQDFLHPIYFNVFDTTLNKVGDIEASVLLSRLQFHCKNSKILRDGKVWFTRQKEEIASWFSITTAKLDTLLKKLESQGLIFCDNFKYQEIRQLHISVPICQTGYVHFEILEKAISLCGGIKEALILLRILYHYEHSVLEIDGLKWVTKSREELAAWARVSVRTLDTIISKLEAKGIFIKRNYKWNGAPQSHFHLPKGTFAALFESLNDIEEIKSKPTETYPQTTCNIDTAKIDVPYINKNINQNKKTNNTTKALEREGHDTQSKSCGDMNFRITEKLRRTKQSLESQVGELNERQLSYLEGALKMLIVRDNARVSNPKELIEQLKFSIGNWVGSQKLSFTHAVNRAFAIIRKGNWRTPIGFSTHSPVGQNYKQAIVEREREEQEKAARRADHNDQRVISFMTKIADFEARVKIEKDALKRSVFEMQISKLRVELFDLSRV